MPSALATLPNLNAKEPVSIVTCPPESEVECVYMLILSMQRKSAGKASAAKSARRVVVASVNVTVKPGKKKTVKFKLNAAGKRLARTHRNVREELQVTVHAGTVSRSFTESRTARS